VYDEFSESLRINAERIMDMDTARDEYARRLILKLDARQFTNGLVGNLADAIAPFRDGGCPIYAAYSGRQVRAQLVFDAAWSVRPEETLLRQLRELLGEGAVAVQYR
jgi:DNA polymerase-3 subunit alpha